MPGEELNNRRPEWVLMHHTFFKTCLDVCSLQWYKSVVTYEIHYEIL